MSALAAAQVSRAGAARLTVINRTEAKAKHLAASTGADSLPWEDLPDALAHADVVVTCTRRLRPSSRPTWWSAPARAVGDRSSSTSPCRETSTPTSHSCRTPASSASPTSAGASRCDPGGDVDAVRDLVTGEGGDLVMRRSQEVGPTVAALRASAAQVVAAEVRRSRADCLSSTTRPDPRSTARSTGWSTSSCTPRRCGSSSSRPTTAARPRRITPRRCASSSTSTPARRRRAGPRPGRASLRRC